MKTVYFLGYRSDEFKIIKEELKTGLKGYDIIEYLGHNIDIKEFVRIKLKKLELFPDYFLLDVRALENTDYTTILSFKSNIMDKYPELKGFLVIAQQADGLSTEEYNDIIRNSVNGKNYTLFCDSDSEKTAKEIVGYIYSMDERKKKEKENTGNARVNKEEEKADVIDKNLYFNIKKNEEIHTLQEDIEIEKTDEGEEGCYNELLQERKKISDNESFKSMKRRLCAEEFWEQRENTGFLSDEKGGGNPKLNLRRRWLCKDEIVVFFGSKSGIGTSFVAMNLAMSLSDAGAKSAYVQFSKLPNMDEMARDYGMRRIEGYYGYDETFFVKNEFLSDMNCHVLDLGADYYSLERAIELEWLTENRLFIVSNGNNEGLKQLDDCLFHLKDKTGVLNLIIVNPILNKSRYEAYEGQARVYYFEHVKVLNDDRNSYNLRLMTDEIYRNIHQKQ